MRPSFPIPPSLLRSNHPLRRPSSSPAGVPTASIPQIHGPKPAQAEPSAGGEGISRDTLSCPEAASQAVMAFFCHFCGQRGHFQCIRCRKTTYCSVFCQTEDWKAHRHMCSSTGPDPVIEKPKETIASPVMGGGASLPDCKNGDASGLLKVYLDHLPKAEIKKRLDMQVLVIEFHSPSRFFILAQRPETIETLQNISAELQRTFSGRAPAPPYVPCLGEVCAVQFSSDLKWYRGLVQTVAPSQETANILYIDFGNEEDVPVDRINPLAANIPLVAPCAMECRVAGVVPVSDSWSAACCAAVRPKVVGKSLTVSVVDVAGNGHVYAVDVALSSGKQLSTLLIEQGYGAEEEEVTTTADKDMSVTFTASLETCLRLSDGPDENTCAPPPIRQAHSGDTFSAMVTHLQSPDEMFVQKLENAGVTRELQLSLREHCGEIPTSKTFRPTPGTTCCAQFSEDKQWYRAKVSRYLSQERVCVVYIDFGNSEQVPTFSLRPISAALLAVPAQAFPCALAGVQPVGESWSEECVLALMRRVSNTILRVDVQGAHQGKALVTMTDETCDPQADVAQLLLSAGYAVPATNGTIQQEVGSSQQQAEPRVSSLAPQAATEASEPLRRSNTELPCDGQTVALLASVPENPGESHCRIDDPTGAAARSPGRRAAAPGSAKCWSVCVSDLQQLRDVEAELKQRCEEDSPSFTPKVGEPCCAMFPAAFSTYGTQVEKSGLRPVAPRLSMPSQAARCCLTEASFPLNWKTVELPVNHTFRPIIAAAVCPSLLYLLSLDRADAGKLQAVTTELATYCGSSSPALSAPVPGAACCAQFSADGAWYRAVVLEASDSDVSVLYADYGNTETLPSSRILPIPPRLLRLPFRIARCALAGKERFPAVWPANVLQMFQAVLLNGVVATVQSFDGSANLLSLSLPAALGGAHLTTMMLDALRLPSQAQPGGVESAPDDLQPKSIITEPEPNDNMSAHSVRGSQTSSCCCASLETKVDHLEQLLQLQLSLIKQLVQLTL